MLNRRHFLKTAGGAAFLLSAGRAEGAATNQEFKAEPAETGLIIPGFYPTSIGQMKDASLMTERGFQSSDSGRTWKKSPSFRPVAPNPIGLLRLPNGELGSYYDKVDDGRSEMDAAVGNATNRRYFCWSADEGRTWSAPVAISLPGLMMGVGGTMFALKDGRLIVSGDNQWIGSRFDKRGATWGSYKGVRFQTETEAHNPEFVVTRVHYSDDNGRKWTPCDGWIMGWRDNRWSESFCEASGVELKNGTILLLGRTNVGRLYEVQSDDRGHSWWPGAKPTPLMASYSPCRVGRLPGTGDLLVVWNQVSRAEIRKGFRRCRLSTAISKDEGKTWTHFKNLEAIKSLARVSYLPPDPDLTPVWGDDQVGELSDDFAAFSYTNLSLVGREVFISIYAAQAYVDTDAVERNPSVKYKNISRTRILPEEWFYGT